MTIRHGNKIKSILKFPSNLSILYCANNQLSVLPELPTSLEYLSCKGNNFIENLTLSFPSLFEIICRIIKKGNVTLIREVDEKLDRREICKDCGLASILNSIRKKCTFLEQEIVMEYKRCWVCIRKY